MDGYGSRNSESLKVFIYRFLQRLFSEPDVEFYTFLLQNSNELKEIGIELGNFLDLETLQTEYTRLFLGPEGHSPLYQSVFLEARFWGNPTVEIKDFINNIGLELDKNFNMPPDHISIEFEILEKILVSNHPESRKLFRDFFNQHVLWIVDYIKIITEQIQLDFYETSFNFARSFLEGEATELKETCRSVLHN